MTKKDINSQRPLEDISILQWECICWALYQAHDGEALTRLFTVYHSIRDLQPGWSTSRIAVAYVYALLHSSSFERMYEVIRKSKFAPEHFKELQDIWYEGRYRENAAKRGKELGAVEKYRLRRKYPPPGTIWDGQETVYSFKENSRKKLKQFYINNKYPTNEDKKEISRVTDLELTQISNWFKNRRQRDKTSKDPVRNPRMTIGYSLPIIHRQFMPQQLM